MKPLPCDMNAEHSVLGSVLLLPRCCDEIGHILEPEHFHGEANSIVFTVVRDMYHAGKFIDAVTVANELKKRKQLDAAGGPEHLLKLMEAVPHAAHATHYAQIVREMADRRSIIINATEMLSAAYDASEEASGVLAKAEQAINRLSEARATGCESVDLMTVLVDAVTRIENGTTRGIGTGFGDLDDLTTGIHPGQLIVIAARPGVGKSAFAVNLAYNMSVKIPTIYFSLEMSRLELAERLVCLESQVSLHLMRSGDMDATQQFQMKQGAEMLYDKKIQIDDFATSSISRLSSVARYMQRKHKVGLVIVDYLQLLTPTDRKLPREQQIAEMTRGLKQLAKSMDVPVIVLAQLNREIEKRPDKRPRLSDLRESGAIEQDADQVWFLHRPALYMDRTNPKYDDCKYEANVFVEKNRSGPTGKVNLTFFEETMRFCAMSVDSAMNAYDGRF